MNIHQIATYLNGLADQSATGLMFDCVPIAGEVDVLRVDVKGREEIPVFVSVTGDQILCISYLWDEKEVIEGRKSEMMEAMLEMNIPMPLSAFAKIEQKYVVFGALSEHSALADIEHEISVLSDNSLEVIAAMTEFLK